jgi:alkanesulfonate monooxygenase SsuD/methylene tetrahydromethanopterin reductase-like flavin-dependent oxidoreductase (luciferase family)
VILGVGSGHLRAEFAVLGADFAVRGRVSDEYLQAIAAAWTEEVAHFGGDTVAYRDLLVSPRPLQRPRPPIWVGGNSRAAVRRAARYADGWVPWEVDRDGLPTVLATARSLRARAGRPAAFEVVAPLTLPAGTGVADAVALALRWREAGATAFHVGLPARSGEEWLDRIAWLGAEIAPRLAA